VKEDEKFNMQIVASFLNYAKKMEVKS